jgi:antitoxin MazE
MAEAVLAIKQWGNILGVSLPAAVAREAYIHVNQRMRVSIAGAQVIITPIEEVPLSLERRLAVYDPSRHGGKKMGTAPMLVAERW